MAIADLLNDSELATLTSEHDWVLVDFWAPWCGPCRTMGPVFQQLADRYPEKLKAIKANVDKLPELAKTYSVRGIPTLLLLRKGEAVGKLVGAQSEQAIDQWLNEQWRQTI